MRSMTKRSGAFTLIEVLMVIALILILISLALAGASALTQGAQRKMALTQANVLVNAIKTYKTTYGKWPGQDQDKHDVVYNTNASLVILALTNNPRNVQMLDSSAGTITNGTILDPWYSAFVVAIDENDDGVLSFCCTNALYPGVVLTAAVNETVAVISWGKNPFKPGDRVYSWQK
ncbi:MAG: hypothetical protein C0404_13985 [Verrucomicrobia bacterium]|nr:hypothetical protein [Verrucomicrobiota bacterium]